MKRMCEYCDRSLIPKDFTTLAISGVPFIHDFMIFCRPCATELLTELMDNIDDPEDIEIIRHRPRS